MSDHHWLMGSFHTWKIVLPLWESLPPSCRRGKARQGHTEPCRAMQENPCPAKGSQAILGFGLWLGLGSRKDTPASLRCPISPSFAWMEVYLFFLQGWKFSLPPLWRWSHYLPHVQRWRFFSLSYKDESFLSLKTMDNIIHRVLKDGICLLAKKLTLAFHWICYLPLKYKYLVSKISCLDDFLHANF